MISRLLNASLIRRLPSTFTNTSTKFLNKNFTLKTPFNRQTKLQDLVSKRQTSWFSSNATPEFEAPLAPKSVGYWLLGMGGLTFGIVVVGGLTRLTESGLSITEWNLIKGMKYPSTPTEWEVEFEKYRQSPEYHKLNHHMTVDEFKNIYFMEWFHRMWGRFIGLAFLGPLAYFWAKGKLAPSLKPKLLALGGLIGFQGALGWYMVKSGLDQQLMQDPNAVPRVSAVRLASHLGSAFILYAGFMKLGWDVLKPKSLLPTPTHLVKFAKASHAVTGLIFLTAMSGALVAGLDAGMIYNEFPYMGETIVPALQERWNKLFARDPKTGEGMWYNFVNNPTLVQFNHRVLAVTTFCSVMGLYAYSRNLALNRSIRIAVRLMAGIAIVQVSLGIGTLIYSVPINLAAAHQSGSLALLTSGMWLMHTLKRIPK